MNIIQSYVHISVKLYLRKSDSLSDGLNLFSRLGSSSSVDASSFGRVIILSTCTYLTLNFVIHSLIVGTFKSVCKTSSVQKWLQNCGSLVWNLLRINYRRLHGGGSQILEKSVDLLFTYNYFYNPPHTSCTVCTTWTKPGPLSLSCGDSNFTKIWCLRAT
jgi:hypothetical protein